LAFFFATIVGLSAQFGIALTASHVGIRRVKNQVSEAMFEVRRSPGASTNTTPMISEPVPERGYAVPPRAAQ
jgi:hypothetical protein